MEFAVFWIFCAVVTAFIAANRGRNSFKWFALGLLIGPFAFIFAAWPSAAKSQPRGKKTDAEG